MKTEGGDLTLEVSSFRKYIEQVGVEESRVLSGSCIIGELFVENLCIFLLKVKTRNY